MNKIAENFYTAFAKLDAEQMAKYYHPDIVFQDPAFGELKGKRAMNMWRMLCDSQKGKDFKIQFEVLEESENQAKVNWEAFYTFSKTGRKVHNKISASLVIKDGLILKHTDEFNLYRWSKQAMGWKGFLMGYSSFFRNKLQYSTNRLLDTFEQKLGK